MREDVSKLQQRAPRDVQLPRPDGGDIGRGVDLAPLLAELEQLRCEQARIGVDLPRALQDLRESQGAIDFSPVLAEIAKVGARASAIDLSPVLAELNQLKASIGEDLPRALQDLRESQGNIDFSPVLAEIAKVGDGAIDLSPVLAGIDQLKASIGEDLPRALQELRESQGNIDFSPVLDETAKLTQDLRESHGSIDFSPVLDEIAKLTQDLRERHGSIDFSPVLDELAKLTQDRSEGHGNTDVRAVLSEAAKLTAGSTVDSNGVQAGEHATGRASLQQAMLEISRMRDEMGSQQAGLRDDASSVADESKDGRRPGDLSHLQAEIAQLRADVIDEIEKLKDRSGADFRGEATLAELTTQMSGIREDVASLLEEARSEMPSADGNLSAVLEDLRRIREAVETDLPRFVTELVENNQPSVEIKVDDSSLLERVWVDVQ
ncbi:unnamed protein product [Prorocentrum cordatum]|uniref:Uncharacterized protein n=1 Tax=Prorocentrum cordatum TaxID=2364126 RepID=A0ABN9T0G6_9DINO|nr:unnamed protein product [Polarella glacialis]